MAQEGLKGFAVESMAGLFRPDPSEKGMSQKRDIAHQVQDLVTDEFVAEPERRVDHFLIVQGDRVIQAASERQPSPSEFGSVAQEAERSGRRDF
jgi:hypothetical protein